MQIQMVIVSAILCACSAMGQSLAQVRQFGTARLDITNEAAFDAGSVYFAGRTTGAIPGYSNLGSNDAVIRKYDLNGIELWSRQFGDFNFDDALGIAVDASGVYTSGQIGNGALPGQTQRGGGDAFLRKYDSDGTEIWTRQFGSTSSDFGHRVALGGGGVYVTGRTLGALAGTNAGSSDIFVRKFDSSGNELWTRQVGSPAAELISGIATDASGVYIAGTAQGTLPGQAVASGAYLIKYSHDGTLLWTRQIATSNGSAVTADSTGVYLAGGATALPGLTSAGSFDAFVRKYDSNGIELWTRLFGTPGEDIATFATVDSSGIFLTGYVTGALPGKAPFGEKDGFVRKYAPDGSEAWTLQYGTSRSDDPVGIGTSGSGRVLVAGASFGVFAGQSPAETGLYILQVVQPAPTPVVTSVVNGASFLNGIASGSWFTIRGNDLAPVTRIWDAPDFQGTRLPLSLNSVSVKVNGRDAPVYFISPTQINALAPADTFTGNVTVSVTVGGSTSAPATASLQRVVPGLFAFSQRGSVYPAAVHQSGTFVGPTDLFDGALPALPATPGGRILLYATGLGSTNPAVDPLVILNTPAPLASLADLRVLVGGIAATIEFAGMTSNGLYQVNIVVPTLADGEHTLVIEVGGVRSQTLRLPVRR